MRAAIRYYVASGTVLAILVISFSVLSLMPRPGSVAGGSYTSTIFTTSIATSTSTFVTTSTVFSTSTSVLRPSGPYATMITSSNLRLELALNTSRVSQGGGIQIWLNLTNILSKNSIVGRGFSWPIQGLMWPPLPGCGTEIYPLGIAVIEGHYAAGNVSSGTALNLTEPGIYFCPNWDDFRHYDFEPLSNHARANTTSIVTYSSASIAGFWTGGVGNGSFMRFSPGTYTVVEGDEWGDMQFLYFVVA